MAKLYVKKSDGTYVPQNSQSVTNIDVVQTTGNSVTSVMSQDAVTKELSELEGKTNTKQDKLTLTVKDNGNIVIANIQGQSKEFMPATPSGDPMHYAYVAAGAEWNGTGADIVKTTPWADLADNDADKTVVHKAGYWYLNGLGDITTEQMRAIYNNTISFGDSLNMNELLYEIPIRTNFSKYSFRGSFSKVTAVAMLGYNRTVEVIKLSRPDQYFNIGDASYMFSQCNVRYVLGVISSTQKLSFSDLIYLKTIKISNIAWNISFSKASMLTSKSILYMIQNEGAKSTITITLHADAYARAMANADIVAALEAHPNVSLASA